MPYLLKYCVIYHTSGGPTAYGLKETMDMMGWMRDNGRYHWGRCTSNIRVLEKIRRGELVAQDATFLCPRKEDHLGFLARPLSSREFFSVHGHAVGMAHFTEEQRMLSNQMHIDEWAGISDEAAVDAAETTEYAHALWNLWNDGWRSQDSTVDSATAGDSVAAVVAEVIDLTGDDDEDDLMTAPIGEIDVPLDDIDIEDMDSPRSVADF